LKGKSSFRRSPGRSYLAPVRFPQLDLSNQAPTFELTREKALMALKNSSKKIT
jgi:hypothetical protein